MNQFLVEVSEQPQALRDLVAWYGGEGVESLARWSELAREFGRVVFAGMGTSEFAPASVTAAMGQSGVDATYIDAGELLHYPTPVTGLLALISQSGESIETRQLAERAPEAARLIALTNYPESTLGRTAALVLELRAGYETAVSTKTYVNTLAVLHLMEQALRGEAVTQEAVGRLGRLAQVMAQVDETGIERAAGLLADAKAIHFITRGPALAAAKQAALTFMEGTRITSAAFAGGAFRHGPLETADEEHRCVFLTPGGKTTDLLTAMAQEVAGKGSHAVIITDQELALPSEVCVLRVPEFGEALFPIAAATTQELLMNAVAARRGLVPGEFRYGEKVTGVE